MNNEIEKLKQINADLLNICKTVEMIIKLDHLDVMVSWGSLLAEIRKAISKAEGE